MRQEILLKQKIGMRLARAGALARLFAIQSFLKAGFEITPEQFTVLMALNENNGMYLRQLADITFKDRPNMTRIVSILENGGYVTSELAADGRQVKKLYITDKGRETCAQILPEILNVWNTMIKGIPEDNIDDLLRIIDRIEFNLKENTILQS